jgi:DNA-binding CsgD family transcriptional regulator
MREASQYDKAQALEEHFIRVLSAFGFDRYSCARLDGGVKGQHPAILSTRNIEDWDRHWREQGYDAIDPVAHLARSGAAAFTWSHARAWARTERGPAGKTEDRMWGEARESGMGDGMVSRALGPGGETLFIRMTTPDRMIRPADRPILDAVGIVFCTLRLRLHEREQDRQLDSLLTLREQQCLRWASQGLIDAEVSEQLGISIKTVAFHMENAKRKLGARTRLAAYRRAQELGLLT